MLRDNTPPNMNANFDVYPNIAELAQWWRLGNLLTDGIDKIIKTYRYETTPGMKANREIQISELARKYGNSKSEKLYSNEYLIIRFMRQWGLEYFKSAS